MTLKGKKMIPIMKVSDIQKIILEQKMFIRDLQSNTSNIIEYHQLKSQRKLDIRHNTSFKFEIDWEKSSNSNLYVILFSWAGDYWDNLDEFKFPTKYLFDGKHKLVNSILLLKGDK